MPTRPGRIGNPKGGAATKYSAAFVGRVFELCLLGLSDAQIADCLGTAARTMAEWRKRHPEFKSAFDRGRTIADGKIARALYKRAKGYSHPAEKIFLSKDGQIVRASYIQHYPPDTGAMQLYLTNRQRALWFSKPGAEVNLNISLETVVLNALKLNQTRKQADTKLIEANSDAPLLEYPGEPTE